MEIKQKTNYQYLFPPKQHNRKDNSIDIVLMKLLEFIVYILFVIIYLE